MSDKEVAWNNLLRRIRQRSPVAEQGQAIITVSVVVQDDMPVLWTKPQVVMIEPGSCDIRAVIGAQSVFGEDREGSWCNLIRQLRVCVPATMSRAVVSTTMAICKGIPVAITPPKVIEVAFCDLVLEALSAFAQE